MTIHAQHRAVPSRALLERVLANVSAAGLAEAVWGFIVGTVAYCSLKVPAFFGIVRELREQPAWMLRSDRRVSRANVARLRAWSRRVQEDRA